MKIKVRHCPLVRQDSPVERATVTLKRGLLLPP